MRKWTLLLAALAVVSFMGCAEKVVTAPAVTATANEGETVEVAYCGDCGNMASDACCDENAEKCDSCNMAKGSALCCKLEGDFAGKKLCTKCGQIAATEACCDENAENCEKCELAKGSPLCCKLTKADGEATKVDATEGDEDKEGESEG